MKHHIHISHFYIALLEYYPLHQAEWQTRWHNPPDWGLVSSVAICLALRSVIQQRVYETRVHDIDELRQCLLHVWHGLEQSLTDDAVDQCLYSCRWRTFWTYFVNINLFSRYLINFKFHIMLDAAYNILCDVSFSLGSLSALFRWGGHFWLCVKHFFLFTTVQKL